MHTSKDLMVYHMDALNYFEACFFLSTKVIILLFKLSTLIGKASYSLNSLIHMTNTGLYFLVTLIGVVPLGNYYKDITICW